MATSLPYRTDITLYKGASFSRKIIWTKKSDGLPAVDLSEFKGELTIKPLRPGATIRLTTENGGLVFDPVEGSITIVITSAQTALYKQVDPAGFGKYDLLLKPKVGVEPVYAIIHGVVKVLS